MALKRKQSIDDTEFETVFRSDPIVDRRSTFIGYFSPTLRPEELQKLVECQDATHKILGWRRTSTQQTMTGEVQHTTGFDDDGEKYGASKIVKVLKSSDAIGACVVARWYGDVMIGQARFLHIETCAEEAINRWRRHLEEGQLLNELEERDLRITELRTLLFETEQRVKAGKPVTPDSVPTSPVASQTPVRPPLDYKAMPLDSLRALAKSRGASIKFLLKRIDEVNAKLAASNAAPTKATSLMREASPTSETPSSTSETS